MITVTNAPDSFGCTRSGDNVTPGHRDIQGNVLVDAVAKWAAEFWSLFVYHVLTGI